MKIYWNKESNSKNLIGQRVKELRTERQLSQKALAEILGLIILPVKCNTYLEKGGHKMNEVFERLSDVFEELRSDAGEREYSIQTEEAKKADKELKKENREYEKFLSDLSTEQRNFLENYMDIVDHAHFQEQQRAYYQGIVDAVQILLDLGLLKRVLR